MIQQVPRIGMNSMEKQALACNPYHATAKNTPMASAWATWYAPNDTCPNTKTEACL